MLTNSVQKPLGRTLLALLSLTMLISAMPVGSLVHADDTATKEAPAESDAKPDAVDSAASFFTPPEGTESVKLLGFIRRLLQQRPQPASETEAVEQFQAMDKAFAEILSRDVDDEVAQITSNERGQELMILSDQDETAEAATKSLEVFITKLEKDERPEIAELGVKFRTQQKINTIPDLTAEERGAFVEQVAEKLKSEELSQSDIQSANQVASMLEELDDPKEAIAAYNLFAKYLDTSKVEGTERICEMFRASASRLELLGSTMELKGRTIDGKEFDLVDWKGKVVLVDFWATWCGPCMQELPNVLAMYDGYHEKGFEVVGISLDDDAGALNKFLKRREIPWTTLFEQEEEKQGWDHPAARQYNISGIPSAYLINKEGKVVSLNARGPILQQKLADLLGPPAEPKPGADKGAEPLEDIEDAAPDVPAPAKPEPAAAE